MIKNHLEQLGGSITRLRIAKQLKQSELAFEAGISERTLQRLEAGQVVKSDGLLKVIAYLGRLDDMLEGLKTAEVSPLELATRPGNSSTPRKRVRRAKSTPTQGKVQWPEDQE